MQLRLRSERPLRGLLLALTSSLLAQAAAAHGDWPARHGGVMNDGGETSFELVRDRRSLVAHVSDHGVPQAVTGSRPELRITRTGRLRLVEGMPRGDRIVFPAVAIEVGDGVAVKLVMANGSVAFGSFAPAAVAALAARQARP